MLKSLPSTLYNHYHSVTNTVQFVFIVFTLTVLTCQPWLRGRYRRGGYGSWRQDPGQSYPEEPPPTCRSTNCFSSFWNWVHKPWITAKCQQVSLIAVGRRMSVRHCETLHEKLNGAHQCLKVANVQRENPHVWHFAGGALPLTRRRVWCEPK